MLTDEYGIPIYEQTLDGNTSDSTWIKNAIHHFQGIPGDDRSDYTFIAIQNPENQNSVAYAIAFWIEAVAKK